MANYKLVRTLNRHPQEPSAFQYTLIGRMPAWWSTRNCKPSAHDQRVMLNIAEDSRILGASVQISLSEILHVEIWRLRPCISLPVHWIPTIVSISEFVRQICLEPRRPHAQTVAMWS